MLLILSKAFGIIRICWVFHWIGVSDAAALFEEYKQKSVDIIMEPVNFPWALEMRITDLDGHVLRFGSDPLS
jgi:hypothetical protein